MDKVTENGLQELHEVLVTLLATDGDTGDTRYAMLSPIQRDTIVRGNTHLEILLKTETEG